MGVCWRYWDPRHVRQVRRDLYHMPFLLGPAITLCCMAACGMELNMRPVPVQRERPSVAAMHEGQAARMAPAQQRLCQEYGQPRCSAGHGWWGTALSSRAVRLRAWASAACSGRGSLEQMRRTQMQHASDASSLSPPPPGCCSTEMHTHTHVNALAHCAGRRRRPPGKQLSACVRAFTLAKARPLRRYGMH